MREQNERHSFTLMAQLNRTRWSTLLDQRYHAEDGCKEVVVRAELDLREA